MSQPEASHASRLGELSRLLRAEQSAKPGEEITLTSFFLSLVSDALGEAQNILTPKSSEALGFLEKLAQAMQESSKSQLPIAQVRSMGEANLDAALKADLLVCTEHDRQASTSSISFAYKEFQSFCLAYGIVAGLRSGEQATISEATIRLRKLKLLPGEEQTVAFCVGLLYLPPETFPWPAANTAELEHLWQLLCEGPDGPNDMNCSRSALLLGQCLEEARAGLAQNSPCEQRITTLIYTELNSLLQTIQISATDNTHEGDGLHWDAEDSRLAATASLQALAKCPWVMVKYGFPHLHGLWQGTTSTVIQTKLLKLWGVFASKMSVVRSSHVARVVFPAIEAFSAVALPHTRATIARLAHMLEPAQLMTVLSAECKNIKANAEPESFSKSAHRLCWMAARIPFTPQNTSLVINSFQAALSSRDETILRYACEALSSLFHHLQVSEDDQNSLVVALLEVSDFSEDTSSWTALASLFSQLNHQRATYILGKLLKVLDQDEAGDVYEDAYFAAGEIYPLLLEKNVRVSAVFRKVLKPLQRCKGQEAFQASCETLNSIRESLTPQQKKTVFKWLMAAHQIREKLLNSLGANGEGPAASETCLFFDPLYALLPLFVEENDILRLASFMLDAVICCEDDEIGSTAFQAPWQLVHKYGDVLLADERLRPTVVSELLKLLASKDDEMHAQAYQFLKTFFTKIPEANRARVISAFLMHLNRGQEEETWWEGFGVLIEHAPDISNSGQVIESVLKAALSEQSTQKRQDIGKTLARFAILSTRAGSDVPPASKVITSLLAALYRVAAEDRKRACELLGVVVDEVLNNQSQIYSAVGALVLGKRFTESDEEQACLQHAVAALLGRIHDSDPTVNAAAWTSLGKIASRLPFGEQHCAALCEKLLTVLQEKKPNCYSAAAEALHWAIPLISSTNIEERQQAGPSPAKRRRVDKEGGPSSDLPTKEHCITALLDALAEGLTMPAVHEGACNALIKLLPVLTFMQAHPLLTVFFQQAELPASDRKSARARRPVVSCDWHGLPEKHLLAYQVMSGLPPKAFEVLVIKVRNAQGALFLEGKKLVLYLPQKGAPCQRHEAFLPVASIEEASSHPCVQALRKAFDTA